MNRIEQIKHKVEWSSYHGDISANEVEGDIQYLLSKLEIAENGLTSAINDLAKLASLFNADPDNQTLKMDIPAMVYHMDGMMKQLQNNLNQLR